VARVTVRRALRKLTGEGLIRVEPGRGYRALPAANGLRPGSPVAYVVAIDPLIDVWTSTSLELSAAIQRVLVDLGWHALAMSSRDIAPEELPARLVQAGVWGVIMDTNNDRTRRALAASGRPCVCVDSFPGSLDIDCILQDNHGGARLAAEYLLDRGHRRIGWFGDVGRSDHSLERFTGAQAAFLKRGLELPRELIAEPADGGDAALDAAARTLLSRPDRPTAVLAMWTSHAVALARVARALGLEIGRDLDMVAWSTELGYRAQLEREFGAGRAPAAVIWNPEEMARLAVARLHWRLREPGMASLRITVPLRLIPAGSARG